jgi:hypothetical protein
MENMYSKADDLDPQPEFPLRTQLTFYEQLEQPAEQVGAPLEPVHQALKQDVGGSNEMPLATLLLLWIFGLVVWCVVFVNQGGGGFKPAKRSTKKKAGGYKDT